MRYVYHTWNPMQQIKKTLKIKFPKSCGKKKKKKNRAK